MAAQRQPANQISDYLAPVAEASVTMGEHYGLYDVLAQTGPVTPLDLSRLTCTALWFSETWLRAQHAAGYLQFDAEQGTYRSWCSIADRRPVR